MRLPHQHRHRRETIQRREQRVSGSIELAQGLSESHLYDVVITKEGPNSFGVTAAKFTEGRWEDFSARIAQIVLRCLAMRHLNGQ